MRQSDVTPEIWKAHLDELNRARSKRWREKNPQRKKEISDRYIDKHRERLNAKQREKNKTPERKAFLRDYLPKHRARNPEMYRGYTHNRKLRMRGTHTLAEWKEKLAEHNNCCAYCGSPDNITRDHDIPVSRGGANTIDNIVPACAPCNYSKKAMTGDEFRAYRKKAA